MTDTTEPAPDRRDDATPDDETADDATPREGETAQDDATPDDATPQEGAAQLVLPPGTRGPGDDTVDTVDGDQGTVEEPAKVMRIGTMIKRLLDEVRESPLDEEARARLASIHERSLHELEDGLSDDLVAELHRITLPFTDDRTPTDAELRIAQAQLVGWLEGLFHGIQTALVAQQLAAQQQLTQMRRLPPGLFPTQGGPVGGAEASGDDEPHDRRPTPGQYL